MGGGSTSTQAAPAPQLPGGGVQPLALTCNGEPQPPPEQCVTWTCSGGTWIPKNKTNGTSCNDGNACTTSDKCTSGVCGGTAASTSTPCDDGNLCTTGDHCDGAKHCVGAPKSCAATDTCHLAGTCNPATGACSNPAKADGDSCDDGRACTAGDVCTAGVCAGHAAELPCCQGGQPLTSNCCAAGVPTVRSGAACTYACYDDLGRMTSSTVCVYGASCQASCP